MFITGQTNPEVIDCLLCLIFTTWTLKLEILKPLKCLCTFTLPNETASVEQVRSRASLKTSTKPISRLSLRMPPGQPQSIGLALKKKKNKKNVTSVVQWLSHSPCKPGVAGSPNTTTKINLPVESSGAPGTTNPQKQPPILLVSPRKKNLYHAFIIILMLNVNHDFCLNDPVSCSALLSRNMTRRLHCSTSNC